MGIIVCKHIYTLGINAITAWNNRNDKGRKIYNIINGIIPC